MSVIKSEEHQDIFDITLQEFGDIQNTFDMLRDNPTLNINSGIVSRREITINNENKGNVTIKNQFKKLSFVVMNADITEIGVSHGDYNEDYNIDYDNL